MDWFCCCSGARFNRSCLALPSDDFVLAVGIDERKLRYVFLMN